MYTIEEHIVNPGEPCMATAILEAYPSPRIQSNPDVHNVYEWLLENITIFEECTEQDIYDMFSSVPYPLLTDYIILPDWIMTEDGYIYIRDTLFTWIIMGLNPDGYYVGIDFLENLDYLPLNSISIWL